MPVNGLMLTLSTDSARAADALEAISEHQGVETGELQQRWLPVVTDASSEHDARDLHGWLEGLPGVDQVDVILVSVDENQS